MLGMDIQLLLMAMMNYDQSPTAQLTQGKENYLYIIVHLLNIYFLNVEMGGEVKDFFYA